MIKINKKSISLVSIAVLLGSFSAYAESVPVPKERPYQVYLQSLKNTLSQSAFDRLKNINDAGTQKRIMNAVKGSCSNPGAIKKTNFGKAAVKIDHNQCRPAGKPPKGKDGTRCQVSGIKGGKIEAICIKGCCVELSATSDFARGGSGQSGARGISGQGSSNMLNNPGSQSLLSSLFNKMFGMFSGSGGNSGSYSYNPRSDTTNSITDDSITDNAEEGFPNLYQGSDNYPTINDSGDNISDDVTNAPENPEADIETEIYKRQEEKQDATKQSGKSVYRAIKARAKAPEQPAPENPESVQQELTSTDSIELAYNNNPKAQSKDYKFYDSPATGFDKHDKVPVEISLWQRILLFFKSIF